MGYSPWGCTESDTTKQLTLVSSDQEKQPKLSFLEEAYGKHSPLGQQGVRGTRAPSWDDFLDKSVGFFWNQVALICFESREEL